MSAKNLEPEDIDEPVGEDEYVDRINKLIAEQEPRYLRVTLPSVVTYRLEKGGSTPLFRKYPLASDSVLSLFRVYQGKSGKLIYCFRCSERPDVPGIDGWDATVELDERNGMQLFGPFWGQVVDGLNIKDFKAMIRKEKADRRKAMKEERQREMLEAVNRDDGYSHLGSW